MSAAGKPGATVTTTMERISPEGEHTGDVYFDTVELPPYDGETTEIRLRPYVDQDRGRLLIEHAYDHATLITEFEILSETTVRSIRKRIGRIRDPVLKAVVAAGFENIQDPDES